MKYILLLVLVIFVALVAFAYTLPSDVVIKKSIEMKAKPSNIESEVLDLKKWEKWNEWKKIDSTLHISFDEKDSGVGGRVYWGHENKKENSIVLINYKQNEFIEFNLVWNNGSDVSPGKFEFKPLNDSTTKVTLLHTRELGNNPIARLVGAMANDLYDEQFGTMLKNLKKIVEEQK